MPSNKKRAEARRMLTDDEVRSNTNPYDGKAWGARKAARAAKVSKQMATAAAKRERAERMKRKPTAPGGKR